MKIVINIPKGKYQVIKTAMYARVGEDMAKQLIKYIKNGKPLKQEPKTGHWIVEIWNNKEHHTCSECNHIVDYEPCYHYCPYCGAKMESDG